MRGTVDDQGEHVHGVSTAGPEPKKAVDPAAGRFLLWRHTRREVVRQMYEIRTREVAAG
jgi:hypothetical protein